MRSLPFSLVFFLLTACGGGNGNKGSDSAPPPPPPPAANAVGIWDGTALHACDPFPVRAIITAEGKLFFGPPGGLFAGTVTGGSSVRVEATLYKHGSDPDLGWQATDGGDALRIDSVVAQTRLTATWNLAPELCEQGQATLEYNTTLLERPASLDLVAGVYTDGDVTIALNADGVVSGSDVRGCVVNGTMVVPAADRNLYSAALDVDNCSAAGHYEGVAVLGDSSNGGHDNLLTLVAANTEHAIWRVLEK